METRVRYIVVGLFTVAIGFAAVFFVLWIAHSGTLASRRDVRVTFLGSAPGLRAGESVTFNGVRVGDVTAVQFDPANPKVVRARLSIDSRTPLSATTSVRLESEGLMGTVSVALFGGAPGRAPNATGRGKVVEYVAPGAVSLTQQAQAALADLRKLVNENSKPLHETIANLQNFSGVLSKNSARLDNILAGLDRLAGGAQQKPKTPPGAFDLQAPAAVSGFKPVKQAQLVVQDPTSVVALDTQRFLARKADGRLTIETAQWADTIPKLVQKKLIQTFDNVGYKFASPPTDGLRPDYQLFVEVRAFETEEKQGGSFRAAVRLGLRLMGRDGKILATQIVTGEAPASGVDGGQAAVAMNAAFANAMRNLLLWYQNAVGS